ncbi:hypothetical protein RHSIM_Rhsim13G0206800 [Rhododendron simsii]|uniref:F-box domain-containing protein n=1 Tax=Rhododendron simsii TaxID=118357 RepID=A0A834L6J9_RHOSS|nr:hypothetical protein RHSIM_Rhsim13G0206800 [Rhododendron simsii]
MEKSLEEEVTGMEGEEVEEDRCDPFRKRTDDVLGLMLMKLSDPEYLPRCYLVSKHFALFQSQFLSLQLPSSHLIPCQLLPPQYPNPFTTEPPLQQSLMFDSFFDVSTRLLWLTKLVGHSLMTFAILSNSSIKKIDEEGSESEEPGCNSLSDEHYLNWQTTCSMHYANSIYALLLLLVSGHPNIESVEIMDSKKHGKVSLHEEQLTKLKSKSMPPPNILEQKENSDNLVPGYYFTLWYVPELRLPRSGFAMKRVTLGVGAKNMFPSNIDDGTKESANDFGDDVFGEALNEILTNHYVSVESFCFDEHCSLRLLTIRSFTTRPGIHRDQIERITAEFRENGKSLEEEVTAMEEEEENHYHCDPICDTLPDELLGLILVKLSDPKSLLRCSLVSEHFASILFQSQSLSLSLRLLSSGPSSLLIPSHLLRPLLPLNSIPTPTISI